MKKNSKNSIRPQSPKPQPRIGKPPIQKKRLGKLTIGIDLGDQTSRYCMLDQSGEILREERMATSKQGLKQVFGKLPKCRVALEVGMHSPWVSRQLQSLGHEVIVANARQV